MLLWFMLVLITRCSGSDEIPLDRAEPSSSYSTYGFSSAKAIDGDINTMLFTHSEDPAWLRVYFTSSSTVERVVVEKGYSWDAACVITLSVYDGEAETACGTYTGKDGPYTNETVQCGGKRGDSVKIEQTGCVQYLEIYEIKVYGTAIDCDCQNGGECGEPNCADLWSAEVCDHLLGHCTTSVSMQDNCAKTCGFCTVEQGSCNCTEGWTGEKCETRDCNCRNNGTCMSNGTCDCLDGFSGDKCQETEGKDCSKKCRQGKVCYWKSDDQMKCRCPDGSYGKGCKETVGQECRMTDSKVCARKMRKDETKFLEKCKTPWGGKKCPLSCGFCVDRKA